MATLPLRGGGGRVNPIKEKRVHYKLLLVTNASFQYILSRMTNLIYLLGEFLECLVLTLQVLAKIAYNFSPVLLLFLAFVGVMKLIELK
jgi:hypothetical protein